MSETKDEEISGLARVGWFQIQLLMQLAYKSMYGNEIINDLRLNNINISTGQVYPALKKLEASGHLKTFTKRGRSARRKYYQITEHGMNELQRLIRSVFVNLIPVMYSTLDDLKIRLFNNYKIDVGDTIFLYSHPIKQALIDLARLVGDTGKVLHIANAELPRQTIKDLALYYNLEEVILPITMGKDYTLEYERNSVDKAILMLFQREKNLDSLVREVLHIIKPNGKLFILSTKLNILDQTFLSVFNFFSFIDFFDGYTEADLKKICKKYNLTVERSEDIKKIVVIEAIKKEN